MKVPKFVGEGKIEWETRPVPVPGEGQLLLQVKANSLCGSDRKQFYNGSKVTPGHEVMGIVAGGGPLTSTPEGTHGVIFARDFCGECRRCKLGNTSQCTKKRGVIGFTEHGGYDPYILVYENIFFPIDNTIPPAEATLLLDVMGTGSHAIKRAQLIHSDIQSVLVSGAGPIGLGILAMAKIILGDQVPVFISDFVPYRLELAKKLNGIPVLLKETSLEEALRQHGLEKVDAVVDATGKEAARKNGLNVLDRGGVMVCVGHGEGLTIEVAPDIVNTERAIIGSDYFDFRVMDENLQYLRDHYDYLSQIITHRLPIHDLEHAYTMFFEQGLTGKVIVEQ
jgi:threonine 3-dehydrogenase